MRSHGGLAAVGVVAALALSAFSYVTAENLPIGLLTLISADLRTSLSAVGLLVTGYGLTVAVVSVPLTQATRRFPRRWLIGGLLGAFVVTTLASAAASNYWVLLVARVGTALTQAVFWAVVAPTAASLFPPRVRGRVIALTFAGGSLAIVLGVPAGTWLGQQAGWRAAFLALSGLGLFALVAVLILLPDVPPGQGDAATGTHPDARRYGIVLVTTVLAVTGAFTAYTYVVAFLTEVSGFSVEVVSPLLLVFGVGDLIGVLAAGVLVDRGPRTAIVAPVALSAVAWIGLYLFGSVPAAAVVLVALASVALAGVPTAMQGRIMQVAPGTTDLASATNSAGFNVGIAAGSLIGSLLLPAFGVRSTALAGGLLAAAALVVVLSEPLVVAAGERRAEAARQVR